MALMWSPPVAAQAPIPTHWPDAWDPDVAISAAEVPPEVGAFRAAAHRAPASGAPALRAALLSAVLPGAGQYSLGQWRAWVYVGIEAAGWFAYVDRRNAGFELRDAYRDFAWENARVPSNSRIDGDFDYYETLGAWVSSGAFDTDSGAPGVQPETDPARYNGVIWRRATGLFGPAPGAGPGDPAYDAAITYYRDRAYGSEFLWDWSGDPGARDEYSQIIEESDARFRQATDAAGLVIANHVVSAVDAFISGRSLGIETQSRVGPGPAGRGMTIATSIRRVPR